MIPGAKIVEVKGRRKRKPHGGEASEVVQPAGAAVGGSGPRSPPQQENASGVPRRTTPPPPRPKNAHRDATTISVALESASNAPPSDSLLSDLDRVILALHYGASPSVSHQQKQQGGGGRGAVGSALESDVRRLFFSWPAPAPAMEPPRGIINASNHCFLNAITQSLTSLTPFVRIAMHLSSSSHKDDVPTWHAFGKWFESCYMKRIPAATGGSCVAGPRIPFLQAVSSQHASLRGSSSGAGGRRILSSSFDGRAQQDAHEFLILLLETLREELCGVEERLQRRAEDALPPPSATKPKLRVTSDEDDDVANGGGGGRWITVGRGKEKLQVVDGGLRVDALSRGGRDAMWRIFFGGEVHNHVRGGKAAARGVTSVTKEPFVCLSLPVDVAQCAGSRAPSVADLIEGTFGVKERIDASSEHVQSDLTRSQQLGALPQVLILQLKRWAVTAEGEVVKLDNLVRIPVELSVPLSACSASITSSASATHGKVQRQYDLRAVVSHRGPVASKVGSGHYVAYVCGPTQHNTRASCDGRRSADSERPPMPPPPLVDEATPFWLCNDVKITRASHSTMEKDTPYLLFYTKR